MPRRPLIFLVFVVAYFISYFYRSTNAIIADSLVRDLGLSAAQLGLMTSLFFLAFAAAQLPLGSALDRFGPRYVTPLLMLSAVLGSLLFALADSFVLLALGRALIGLGMAGVLMGALKAFSAWFSPQRFATVSGVFLGIGASGALGAATPLVWLDAAFGWRAVFFWGAAVTLLSALAIVIFSRNVPPQPEQSLTVCPDAAPDALPVAGLGDIFSSLIFWRIAALSFAVTGSMFAYQGLWAGPYLSSLGLSEVQAGNLLLLLSGGVVCGYLGIGWLADRFGLINVVLVNAFIFASAQLPLALFSAAWPRWPLGVLFFIFGVTGASSVLFFAHARASFPSHMTARAVTAVNVFGIGGGALLQWGLGLLIGLFPSTASGKPPVAYTAAFLLTALLCLGATLFYLPLRRPIRTRQVEAE